MSTTPTAPPMPTMRPPVQEPTVPDPERQRRELATKRTQDKHAFRLHLVAYLVVNAAFVVMWALSGVGYFWPVFVMLGWGAGVTVHAYCVYVGGNKQAFWLHLAAYVIVNAGFIVTWAVTETSYVFWPILVIFAWGAGVAIHGYTAYSGDKRTDVQIERERKPLP